MVSRPPGTLKTLAVSAGAIGMMRDQPNESADIMFDALSFCKGCNENLISALTGMGA